MRKSSVTLNSTLPWLSCGCLLVLHTEETITSLTTIATVSGFYKTKKVNKVFTEVLTCFSQTPLLRSQSFPFLPLPSLSL